MTRHNDQHPVYGDRRKEVLELTAQELIAEHTGRPEHLGTASYGRDHWPHLVEARRQHIRSAFTKRPQRWVRIIVEGF